MIIKVVIRLFMIVGYDKKKSRITPALLTMIGKLMRVSV
jgi:hypothetical protein